MITAVSVSVLGPSHRVLAQITAKQIAFLGSTRLFFELKPRFAQLLTVLAALAINGALSVSAQPSTFALNSQHTGQYGTPALTLNQIRWSTSIDLRVSGGGAHYGAPVITPSNTVVVAVKTQNGFQLNAFEGSTGRQKYVLTTDYLLPAYGWVPVYQPVLAQSPGGIRLYYPGAGGTIYYIENVDSDATNVPVQQCFYTNMDGYTSNATGFNDTVFINTPITADTNGVIFFGFRVQGTAPDPLNTTNGGFARIDAAGNATYVLADTAAADPRISRDSHNCAPALSNDGTTLYVAVKGTNAVYAYLLGLDSTTLATKYRVLLLDPRNQNTASVLDDATASPMVAPDGDVFFGVQGNPNNGSRGFLLHFTADLQTQKPPGGFGWDFTAAIVPTNMVPSYTGNSPYLLFSKYNNYGSAVDGNGVNRIALLDPSATQIDPHPTANGLVEMREVMTVIGCTPDSDFQGPNYPYAVREWCINTAAVNPATASVFAPCEDGRIYRWNLALNSLTEVTDLGPGFGEPYVPTVVGPDGTVYTLNGGTLFALAGFTNVAVGIYSSAPNLSSVVTGQPITFTAIVTNLDSSTPKPTGTVTFQDMTYQGLVAQTNILAADVPLMNGMAVITNSTLFAGSNYLGNHFITAVYSGDAIFQTGTATLVQKIHASATITTLTSANSNNAVTFTGAVTATTPETGTPTGMLSFWDGPNFLAQYALNTNGIATFTTTNLTPGTHSISANYCSDTVFASSSGSIIAVPPYLTGMTVLSNGAWSLSFSNVAGAPFTVLGAVDLSLSNWEVLGQAIETVPGQFQFIDLEATNNTQRFYRVRSP